MLDDGGYTYLYGNGRIAQYGAHGGEYFLGDALGSVRQLADAAGALRLTRSYQPYGELLASNGEGESVYGFTGEATDALTGMVYLRARWYAPGDGRFTSRDPWDGDYYQPMAYNAWLYTYANPINFVDPSGKYICVPGCCAEWVDLALAQMIVNGGPFSKFVVDMFDYIDGLFPTFIFFTSEDYGAAPIPYVIIMPRYYVNSPPTIGRIAHFAHEIVHQTQVTERYSTWGEAQAHIYSGKIAEELGGEPRSIEETIYNLAFDINSPGFTTRDLHKLCQVRKELLEEVDYLPYRIFPNLINYLVFPQWYTYCEP